MLTLALALQLPVGPAHAAPSPEPHALAYVDATAQIASLALDGGTIEIEMGDLNGDGHVDLASVGDHGSPFFNTQQHGVTVWLGDGAGGWQLRQDGVFGYGGLGLGDLDGDGVLDVVYGVHHDYSATDLGDQLLEAALGNGSGTGWVPWDDGLATTGETWGMAGCDLGDVDADGDLDLLSVSFGCCNGGRVYLCNGDGTWTPSAVLAGSNSSSLATFADVDGDGHLDAVVGLDSALVWRGDGAGGFSAVPNPPGASYFGIGAGDLDGDGRDEVACVAGGGARVFSLTPSGWVERTGDLPAGVPAQRTALRDMDLDGRAELIAVGDDSVTVWRATPAGAIGPVAWSLAASAALGGPATSDAEAVRADLDLDHNGFPDLSIVQDEPIGLFSSRNRHYVLFEASAPTELAVRVLDPSPGRVWRGGQVRAVAWTDALPAGVGPGTVAVELSTTGPDGPWTLLAGPVRAAGRAQVAVPGGVATGNARIRLRLRTSAGVATAIGPPFSIRP